MINSRKFKLIILFVCVVLQFGCAHFRSDSKFEHSIWEKRQTSLRQIKSWSMKGALGVTHNGKRDMARFVWAQNQDAYTLDVSGPLNMGGVSISGNSDGVEFLDADKKCIKAKSLEQLTLDQFGWRLPVSNMRYWILGIPNPKTKVDSTGFDEYGHLVYLEQNGWQLNFSQFKRSSVSDMDLPRTIELRNGDLFIKIKVTGSSTFGF